MNKAELVDKMATKTGVPKTQCGKALDGFIETIKEAAKSGEKVSLVGFGTFTTYKRKSRVGINPQTQQKVTYPAKKVLKFKVSDVVQDSLNKK